MNDKSTLAELTLAKSTDLGVNDVTYMCLTHLGKHLSPQQNTQSFNPLPFIQSHFPPNNHPHFFSGQ
jgi:hypothetical protein